MKKLLTIILAITLCLSLCACPALEAPSTQDSAPKIFEVHITAGKIEPGMTAKDVFVEVTIDHQPVPCEVHLTGFVWDGYWEMADDEPVSNPVSVRLDVFYSVPKGYDIENLNVTMECDGGEYDGTGSISFDDEGNVEAWSHAFYGEIPEPPETETQPTETQPAVTEPPATTPPETQPPATQPLETTPPETTPPETQPPVTQPTETTPPETQPHTHSWTKQDMGYMPARCNADGFQNYVCACGETYQEIIPALEHDILERSNIPPTCTAAGSQTKVCTRCAQIFKIELPATGHSWSAWQYSTGRVHTRTCTVCQATEEENHTIPSGSVTCTGCGADIIN